MGTNKESLSSLTELTSQFSPVAAFFIIHYTVLSNYPTNYKNQSVRKVLKKSQLNAWVELFTADFETHLKPYGKERTPAPIAELQRFNTETHGDSFLPNFLLLPTRST